MAGLGDLFGGVKNSFELGPELGAVYAGQAANMQRQAADYQMQGQLEDLLKSRQAYNQAELVNPLDVQRKQADLAQLAAQLPGQQAESKLKQEQLRSTLLNAAGEDARKQAENANKESVANAEKTARAMDQYTGLLDSGIPHDIAVKTLPQDVREKYESLFKSNIDPTDKDPNRTTAQLMTHYSKSYLEGVRKSLLENAKIQGSLANTGLKSETALEKAAMEIKSREQIQMMKDAAKREAVVSTLDKLKSKGTNESMSIYWDLVADNTTDPVERKAAKAKAAKYEQMRKDISPVAPKPGTVDLGGLPNNRIPTVKQSPSRQAPESGNYETNPQPSTPTKVWNTVTGKWEIKESK